MNPPPKNLLGLTQQGLSEFAEEIGESRYRGKQLFEWLYANGADSFGQMSNLSKSFRERLKATAVIKGVALVLQRESRLDGTTKFLFELSDGLRIESVLIPPASAFRGREAAQEDEQKRLTLCISSQAGCPLGCAFCATATMGFLRNLTTGEIVDQILQIKRLTGKRITNIVFMGMGEPLMNYENVMDAVDIISSGIGIAQRRITISTAGWADRIRQMGDEGRKVKLAVSLHSANDATRSRLMPLNKKFSVEVLISSIEDYYRKTKQRVTYEYIFFDGVNDGERDVAQLVRLARRIPCKINIIPFHPIVFANPSGFGAQLRPSPRTEAVVETLRRSNLTVMVRSNAGEDIDAACGQLAVKVQRAVRKRVSAGPAARAVRKATPAILPIQNTE